MAGLRLLPKNALSRLAGRLMEARWPAALRAPAMRAFGRAVGVDFTEVADPLDRFETLQAFFTRALVPGSRPLDPDPRAFLSPCDGTWGASGLVREGQLMQLKGIEYSLAQLLGDAALAECFEGGPFATLYLSPRDYHRFHAPCNAVVIRADHLPGHLWPVNRFGVEGVPGLFAANERIVARMAVARDMRPETAALEEVDFCLVPVGATLVGRVRLCFDPELVTNDGHRAVRSRHYFAEERAPRLARGEEWGRFEFGSTIVVVGRPGRLGLASEPAGTAVRMGEKIGEIR